MYDLIIYDTSDFQSFPIGGQLTSIRNFLKYIAACQPEDAKRILLVGVTTKQEEIGKCNAIEVDHCSFSFLPVLYRDTDLANVKSSLRLEYVKALYRFRKQIPKGKRVVHYIHTPEAYMVVKLLRGSGKTAIFSHGSFFNMTQGFRFFQNNKLVSWLFNGFLKILLKTADLIFVLDEDSARQYSKYTKKVQRVENSIVLPDIYANYGCHEPTEMLFVGRLSRIKGIGPIIDAVELLQGKAKLTIVGDGEERENLETLVHNKGLEDRVYFAGGQTPDQVKNYYKNCDILVLNSQLEGKPMVILEALSYGLPVVSTNVGGIGDLVRSGAEAEFTDGTPQQIAEKVELIKAQYNIYRDHAKIRSARYDYRRVNADIYESISKFRK